MDYITSTLAGLLENIFRMNKRKGQIGWNRNTHECTLTNTALRP